MRRALDETDRRRKLQEDFNREHGIVPVGIKKAILPGIEEQIRGHKVAKDVVRESDSSYDLRERIQDLEKEMMAAAEALEFERAAELRDTITGLEKGQQPSKKGLPRKRSGSRLARDR